MFTRLHFKISEFRLAEFRLAIAYKVMGKAWAADIQDTMHKKYFG